MTEVIPLVICGDAVLVFDLEYVKRLRELGIVGVLTGTLPKAPQQNVFLGLPLRLSVQEATWLVERGHGVLVDILPGINYAVVEDKFSSTSSNTSNLLKEITVTPERYLRSVFPNYVRKQTLLCSAFSFLRNRNYFLMPGLRFGGDFVAYPGDPLKFHSHLVVRVLDSEEKFDLLQLVGSGRLATAVKKAWVLMDEKNTETEAQGRKDMRCFSIEWAGFG